MKMTLVVHLPDADVSSSDDEQPESAKLAAVAIAATTIVRLRVVPL
jgi:hypothetical protein